jgi:APA family basic amino acid/polyamine antiporter
VSSASAESSRLDTASPPGPRAARPPALRRTLRLWQVSLSGIGVILGAGVYALVGPAAGHAGDALWLAFVLAGLAAASTAYSYARLGSMRPRNSPEFQYTALAFGPRAGFLAGWLMLAADLLAVAAVALGFGGYLAHLAGTPMVPNALGLLVLTSLVLLAGIGESVSLAIVLTVVEVAGLVFVIVIGLPAWGTLRPLEMPHGFTGLSAAAALIFFAYLGFDEIGNFAEEMHQPERNLPRALFISLTASVLVYVLVALAATAAVGWRDLSSSQAPLALVARQRLGPRAETALALVALAATANTVLLLLVAAGRSVYGMAVAGVLPAALARVGGRSVPLSATFLVLGVTAALVLVGDLARAAALTDAAVLVSFLLVNMSLPWLAARGLTAVHRFPRVADVVLPTLAVLLCGWLLLHTGWLNLAATGAFAALGLVFQACASSWGTRTPPRATGRPAAGPMSPADQHLSSPAGQKAMRLSPARLSARPHGGCPRLPPGSGPPAPRPGGMNG